MTIERTLPTPVSIDSDREAAFRDLDEFGYCLIANALSADEVRELRDRLVEIAAREREEDSDYSYEQSNQRVFTLLNKGECFARLAQHPIAIEFAAHALAPVDELGTMYETHVPGPHILLSNLDANIAGPGGSPQGLHNDQIFVPEPWDFPLVLNVAWMLDDFTEENGATRVVPGSHRCRTQAEAPGPDQTIPVCGLAGTAFVFEGRLWHGTGANTTEDEMRHALFTYYCRPYLRPQENFFLSTDPSVVESATPLLRRLLGFEPYLALGSIGGLDRDAPRG